MLDYPQPMNKITHAIYLSIILVLVSIIALPFALLSIIAKEDIGIAESEVSGTSVQQATLNQDQSPEDVGTVSLKEKLSAEQEIQEEYNEYIQNIEMANKFLKENPKFVNIIKSVDEQGVNIVTDDVLFHVEFDEQGLIEGVAAGTDSEYKTIVIHSKLGDFLVKAQNAENVKQLLDLVSDMDMPFEYYLKIPEIVSLI